MIYIVKEKDSFLTSAREFHKLWGLKPVEFAQIDEDLRRRCAVVFAVIVAPNISTYQLADASGSLLMLLMM